jgi:hypothetical protein
MATPMQSVEIQQTVVTSACSCSVEPCGAPAAAEVDTRAVCLEHFLSISFRELRERYERLRNRECDGAETAAFNKCLSSWAGQAQILAEDSCLEDQATKARLREALAWVSRTGRSLRRSPRFEKSVRVWLRREDSRRTWEEDTWTTTVSRHGASFVCRHPVETGGTVFLMRKDKGSRAAAHVVYSRLDSDGCRQIGVELINRDDFWD